MSLYIDEILTIDLNAEVHTPYEKELTDEEIKALADEIIKVVESELHVEVIKVNRATRKCYDLADCDPESVGFFVITKDKDYYAHVCLSDPENPELHLYE